LGMFHSTGQPDHAWTGGDSMPPAPAGYMTLVLPKPSLEVGPTVEGGSLTPAPLSLGGHVRGSSSDR
jgi:hypothetical protein